MKEDKNHTNEDSLDEINLKFDNTADQSEEFQLEEEEANMATTLKKLREKVKELEREKMEYLSGWQRSKADFVNIKKQYEDERTALSKFATLGLIEDLIPVLQSFDSAMANKETWEKVDPAWRTGIEYIYTMLLEVLKHRGVTIINPLHELFDPTLHEAVETLNVSNPHEEGKVLKVLQKGFRLESKVLRPARVVVGHTN